MTFKITKAGFGTTKGTKGESTSTLNWPNILGAVSQHLKETLYTKQKFIKVESLN